jgi:hypothetical protein
MTTPSRKSWSGEALAEWAADNKQNEINRLTAERDSARAWARLWKRVAIVGLANQALRWERTRRITTQWVRLNETVNNKRARYVRRALGLDDTQ